MCERPLDIKIVPKRYEQNEKHNKKKTKTDLGKFGEKVQTKQNSQL